MMTTAIVCCIDIGAMWNGYFADIGRTVVDRDTGRDAEARVHIPSYEG